MPILYLDVRSSLARFIGGLVRHDLVQDLLYRSFTVSEFRFHSLVLSLSSQQSCFSFLSPVVELKHFHDLGLICRELLIRHHIRFIIWPAGFEGALSNEAL